MMVLNPGSRWLRYADEEGDWGAMTGSPLQFVYFADPMCSWCWGFSPVIEVVCRTLGEMLPVRLVMGGLRPGTTEPMPERAKATTREHWRHVEEATGQPFDYGFFDRQGFVYDSDPAARAVVVARRTGQDAGLYYLRRAHRAFYAEGRDVTDLEVLADLAAELGHDGAAFLEALGSEAAKQETWADYGLSQRAGVTGFPTLVLGPAADGTYLPVTRGYAPVGEVMETVRRYFEAAA